MLKQTTGMRKTVPIHLLEEQEQPTYKRAILQKRIAQEEQMKR